MPRREDHHTITTPGPSTSSVHPQDLTGRLPTFPSNESHPQVGYPSHRTLDSQRLVQEGMKSA
ncbi:gamma tubulin ring complex protein 3 [Corchorus olitorius]|uniref:Gamma tubulin ring complex protein 3 n=1 Tax=Corchorus olitorius TaxID=93759 RepID=A0A1R3KU04_9ROSI|nr:gamma tubulin ring complex protein 3 [Corchorus olitorius]